MYVVPSRLKLGRPRAWGILTSLGLVLVVSACGSTTTTVAPDGSAPADAVDAAAAAEPTGTSWPTCDDLVPEVVRISADSDVSILQVYEPQVVADRTADYDSGALTVSEGKTDVSVLDCTGTAAWSDQDSTKLDFRLLMDLNKEQFVSFEPVDG